MSAYTQLKLKPEYRDKLKALADANKRSMANQLEVLIDAATRNSNSSDR